MREARPRILLATLAILLCGCGAPTPNTVVAPTAPVTAVSPSASPSPTGVPADAIDVSAYQDADFATPDGSVRCSLTGEDATCDFPNGMRTTGVPGPEKICPGAPLNVTGVTLSGIAEFFCSRGDDAHPQQKATEAVWARQAGVPTVTVGKEVLVTLPNGRTLVHGKLSCTTTGNAVGCVQSQTKAAFTISTAGAKLTKGK